MKYLLLRYPDRLILKRAVINESMLEDVTPRDLD